MPPPTAMTWKVSQLFLLNATTLPSGKTMLEYMIVDHDVELAFVDANASGALDVGDQYVDLYPCCLDDKPPARVRTIRTQDLAAMDAASRAHVSSMFVQMQAKRQMMYEVEPAHTGKCTILGHTWKNVRFTEALGPGLSNLGWWDTWKSARSAGIEFPKDEKAMRIHPSACQLATGYSRHDASFQYHQRNLNEYENDHINFSTGSRYERFQQSRHAQLNKRKRDHWYAAQCKTVGFQDGPLVDACYLDFFAGVCHLDLDFGSGAAISEVPDTATDLEQVAARTTTRQFTSAVECAVPSS